MTVVDVCSSCFLVCYYGVSGQYRILTRIYGCRCTKDCGHGLRDVVPA